jgi:CubicO group peptidase (beta-lactamase class C family)
MAVPAGLRTPGLKAPQSTETRRGRNIRVILLVVLVGVMVRIAMLQSRQNVVETPPAPAQTIEQLRQQLEAILQETHTAGMSIALVNRGEPEWIAGLGKADLSTGQPVTDATLFRVGSTSKAFVALAILKLANEGRLSLLDPVRKLAPEIWFDNPWEATDPVRVVDLLEHTTGWHDMDLREGNKDGRGMTLREGLDYDHHSRISRWPPGTRMSYSNSGSGVAAYIVEKLNGERFEDYVAQNFFLPIGMNMATYFEKPTPELTAFYHGDGKTPYLYWNILLPPTGALNASARDMAAFLQFFLNRGRVGATQVMPASAIDRIETPTRTWAAQQGLRAGYGLGDFTTVYDGFVYHGHDGVIVGGLTDFEYLPAEGAGYFYSINTNRRDAFDRIGAAIRAYLTRNFTRPAVPAAALLPADAPQYAGWYVTAAPSHEKLHFLFSIALWHVRFVNGRMLVVSGAQSRTFVPVGGEQFRFVPRGEHADPIATGMLLAPNAEGRFIELPTHIGEMTLQRVPEWLAIFKLAGSFWFLFAFIAELVYAPFWILTALVRRKRPAGFAVRLWPLVAVVSLLVFVASGTFVGDSAIPRLANFTMWSFGLFFGSISFAVASVASAVVLWLARKQDIGRKLRWFSVGVTLALLLATAFLAYWGVIGVRTWA